MTVFSPKTTPSYNVRSISFASRSHPTLVRIQDNLNKLLTSSPTSSAPAKSETVLVRLSGLGDIYRCVDDLLQLPLTQQSLSQHHNWVPQMLDDLIRFLDVCSSTKDTILAVKESVRQLQSSLRRSKATGSGDNQLIISFETEITAYFRSQKKMKKEAAKFLDSFKTTKRTVFADNNSVIIKAITEANCVTVSVFSSLLMFLSAAILKPRSSKWPLILSKLVGKESAVACESQQENMNEMQKVDVALNNLLMASGKEEMEYCCDEKIESAQRMLEALDLRMDEFEHELECLFRQLIHTRVTLLNIVSHQLE